MLKVDMVGWVDCGHGEMHVVSSDELFMYYFR